MKHLLILFAIFALVLVAMPVIAAEPAGPPGFAEVRSGSQLFVSLEAVAAVEAAPICPDALGVSNYLALDVAGNSLAVVGSPVRAVDMVRNILMIEPAAGILINPHLVG